MKQLETKQLSLTQSIFTTVTKQVMIVIVLFSMLLNGFVPASQQSKENLFLAATVAVSNSIFSIVGQCRDRLAEVSNNLARDLYRFLLSKEVGTDVPYSNKDQKDPTPVNTSSDLAIVLDQNNIFQLISYKDSNSQLIFTIGKIKEDLYILYKHIKDCCNNVLNTIAIIGFILFVFVVIMRKKDVINIDKINIITGYKTNLY